MTFTERYRQALAQPRPIAPSKAFVREIMEVSKKSESAVRRWLSGDTEPDALTQEVLADHFGTTPANLFPKSSQTHPQ